MTLSVVLPPWLSMSDAEGCECQEWLLLLLQNHEYAPPKHFGNYGCMHLRLDDAGSYSEAGLQ